MHHEIVGPEMTVQTGFVRVPKIVAIEKHIAQYSSFPGGEHRFNNAQNNSETRLSHHESETERNTETISHNLMLHFLIAGNSEMAINTVLNTESVRLNHPELFEAMEMLMTQKLELGDRVWEGFHAILSKITEKRSGRLAHFRPEGHDRAY